MYLVVITWKANSSGTEDNPGSKGSMPGVDELFKSRIMFDNTRSLNRTVWGSFNFKAECQPQLRYTLSASLADSSSPDAALTTSFHFS